MIVLVTVALLAVAPFMAVGAAGFVMIPLVTETVACLRVPSSPHTPHSPDDEPAVDALDRDALAVTSTSGEQVTLRAAELANAAAMITSARASGADDRALRIMLMTALQESRLRNLANPGAVPESMQYPNDGMGHDHDSIGVLQQRPSMGWGSVAELMDPAFAARAFLGGPDGPNRGAPSGLFDLEGWEHNPLGVAAQRVQVSAFPDAYDQWNDAAVAILGHVGNVTPACEPLRASGEGAYPLAAPVPITDGVGPRPCQVVTASGCASSTWHPALDFGAPCGLPVLAARPGTVTVVSDYWVSVTTDDGTVVSYLHMYSSDVSVRLGDVVTAGQAIGAVGNAGPSTGCHLDFRVNTLATSDPAAAALSHIGDESVADGFVDPVAYMALYGVDLLSGSGA